MFVRAVAHAFSRPIPGAVAANSNTTESLMRNTSRCVATLIVSLWCTVPLSAQPPAQPPARPPAQPSAQPAPQRVPRDTSAAAARGRYTFLFVAGPLRIRGGSGSPVNPLAVF
jgi:hypothetical protein